MAGRKLPGGAIFEAELGPRVALYDVSHLLPTNPGMPEVTRGAINRLYVHKSGGIGRAGFAGLLNSVKYVVRKRGFPGPAYTFWVSRKPDKDALGRFVVYRCNRDEVRSWHTGGRCNTEGIAAAIQGNPSRFRLPWAQRVCLDALLRWALETYDLSDVSPISTHSRAKSFGAKKSKPVCPGKHAEKWLAAWLAKNEAAA